MRDSLATLAGASGEVRGSLARLAEASGGARDSLAKRAKASKGVVEVWSDAQDPKETG